MKITSVEPIPVTYPEPNDHASTRRLCLCRITADDGTVGWGEAVTMWEEATQATARVIEGLAPLVIGTDPRELERTWEAMQDHTFWYGRGGIASFAISAIDIALWDLKGKALGVPVVDLLGGAVQQRLPVIASAHAMLADIDEMAETMAAWLDERNLHGIKFGMGKKGHADLGRDHDRDVAFVAALRKAIGPKRDIMVDVGAGVRWDVGTALKRTLAFEESDIRWIEEPLDPTDIEGHRTLREKTTTLIATGEREWNVTGYERLVRSGVVDVVGVDPGRAEGITGVRRIVQRIEAERRWFNAHAWSSAIVTAASVALSASTRSSLVFEVKPLRNPMQHELVENPIEPADGWVSPSEEPGLGVDIVEEVVDRYRVPVR